MGRNNSCLSYLIAGKIIFITRGMICLASKTGWEDILRRVDEFYQSKSNLIWFRGHSKSSYKLNSGMFRDKITELKLFQAREQDRYLEFSYLGHMDHGKSDWELLYVMQHHGVKTRLLDWSESFAISLYFAFKDWEPEKEDACVWMLSPFNLNKLARPNKNKGLYMPQYERGEPTYEKLLFKHYRFLESSIAMYPVRNNRRIAAQRGVFTLQGNSLNPMEEENNGLLIKEGNLVKLTLTKDMYHEVRNYLRKAGVNHYSIYPDLDGLAKLINVPIDERKL